MIHSDDIPEDVWASAVTCAETVCRNLEYDDCTIEINAIADAILTERQRCADAVDKAQAAIMRVPTPTPTQASINVGVGAVLRLVHSAILAGVPHAH